jgi:hypothetical protein
MSIGRTAGSRAVVLATVTAVLVTACGDSVDAPASSHRSPADVGATMPSAPESEAAPPPGTPSRPEPSPDPTAPGACDTATRAAIGLTVGTQLEAFSRGDFDAAYALTSPFFRTLFTRDAFESLIRDAYPALVGNDGHRLDECRARSRRGFLVAGVRSGSLELVLRYDVSQEADGWRIDGAILLPGVTLPRDRVVRDRLA